MIVIHNLAHSASDVPNLIDVSSGILSNPYCNLGLNVASMRCYRYWLNGKIKDRDKSVCTAFISLVRTYKQLGSITLGCYRLGCHAEVLRKLIYKTVYREFYNWPSEIFKQVFGAKALADKQTWYNWYKEEFNPKFDLVILK